MRVRVPQARRCGAARGRRGGSVLLEVILSVSLLTAGGITVLGALSQGVRSLERTRMTQRAADLARSAIARIEAGIESPESLNGPVRAWQEEEGGAFEDAPPDPSGWELEVEFEASEFSGLTRVSVRALRRDPARPDSVLAEHTLWQLVRLGAGGEDRAGEESDLAREIRRQPAQRQPGGGP